MIDLNTVLVANGIDPGSTLVARHRPQEPALRRVFTWIAAERPDLLRAYQQTHWVRMESAMTRARTVVSCIGHAPKQALFTGVYAIESFRRITHAEFWAIPENQELRTYGMQGLAPGAPEPLLFDLRLTDRLAHWSGRLVLTWPGLERSWFRWAARNTIPVAAISEESQLVRAMPAWDELVLSWADLRLLPASWRAALAQWRGVYFIFDVRRQLGYVGSAYGAENLLGRWSNYAATGHGGNVRLRQSDPADLRFSILQRTSPDMAAEEVILLETRWKDRLHTREFGLNEN
ncbi:GIY-YIG nuclease family protein [Phenylobacterium sp.]|uniref:GIY-YIG nuclease family protein n=1 Tax=Phenylobacterium sp. TaxID=1871053 RepID=UPI0035B2E66A